MQSKAVSGLEAAWGVRTIYESYSPPISIPTALRHPYYNALEAADSGDFPAWQNFLTTQLHQELDEWLTALDPASSLNTEN